MSTAKAPAAPSDRICEKILPSLSQSLGIHDFILATKSSVWIIIIIIVIFVVNRARKSRTTLQNKVRLKVLPEQLTLFVNTSVTFKKCIIQ